MLFIKLLKTSTLLLALIFCAGCASDGGASNSENASSSLPWNRPEKWEGPGVVGSMMPGTP